MTADAAKGYARGVTDWRLNNCQVVRLESDRLVVDVLPELGGKIYRLIHKGEDRDYLWQHPRIKPRPLPAASNYDDNFAGGWDELFPSPAPGEHAGELFPDHGEYWTQPCAWQIESSDPSDQSDTHVTLYLRAEGTVTPTRMERWVTIAPGSTVVRFRHRLTHLGDHPIDFLWSLHPALNVGPTHELIIPAGAGEIAVPNSGRLGEQPHRFDWPHAPGRDGRPVDLSQVPARTDESGFEMAYLSELTAGWYAVRDRATGNGFALAFDKQLFNHLWLFQSFGGWRGLNVVIIEPCTGKPFDLAEAAKAGTGGRLEPGQVIETQTTAVIFTGRARVDHVAMDGAVR